MPWIICNGFREFSNCFSSEWKTSSIACVCKCKSQLHFECNFNVQLKIWMFNPVNTWTVFPWMHLDQTSNCSFIRRNLFFFQSHNAWKNSRSRFTWKFFFYCFHVVLHSKEKSDSVQTLQSTFITLCFTPLDHEKKKMFQWKNDWRNNIHMQTPVRYKLQTTSSNLLLFTNFGRLCLTQFAVTFRLYWTNNINA